MAHAGDAPAFAPPRRLVRALGETYGEGGGTAGWLAGLPAAAHGELARHGAVAERVVEPGGRSSVVLLVRRADGEPAALKLAPPAAGPEPERAALAHWDGWGAVRLLDPADGADVRDGAHGRGPGDADGPGGRGGAEGSAGLLLERLRPDVSLRSLPDAKALLEAAGTVRRLWIEPPPGHAFESVADRTERQAAAMTAYHADPTAGPLVSAALEARGELVASGAEGLLLHGCFRQGKVLAGERAPWLAVGPEPVVGERAYDLARLVRDRVEDLVAEASGAATGRRRVNKLADALEVDRDRLRGWTLFRAVESAARAMAAGRGREAENLLEFASWL
ncbi:aminoglycoside phosphotransferase family protein [Streptomyces kanasensis]|uniref:aminoglycoside phosphotransferase family protein n=1 Tax=Streptomyces kanasensis TaxID=936756 RepID=UPI0038249BF8